MKTIKADPGAASSPPSHCDVTAPEGGHSLATEAHIEWARQGMEAWAATRVVSLWHRQVLSLLNNALASELVAALRDWRHHRDGDAARHASSAAPDVAPDGTPDGTPDQAISEATNGSAQAPQLESGPKVCAGRPRAGTLARWGQAGERAAIDAYRQLLLLLCAPGRTAWALLDDIVKLGSEYRSDPALA
jgi:hypothetical protein